LFSLIFSLLRLPVPADNGTAKPSKTGYDSTAMEGDESVYEKDVMNNEAEKGHLSDKGVCLSMHQPWASLYMLGIKRVEGRTWFVPRHTHIFLHTCSHLFHVFFFSFKQP
jgi:hypothetical protein